MLKRVPGLPDTITYLRFSRDGRVLAVGLGGQRRIAALLDCPQRRHGSMWHRRGDAQRWRVRTRYGLRRCRPARGFVLRRGAEALRQGTQADSRSGPCRRKRRPRGFGFHRTAPGSPWGILRPPGRDFFSKRSQAARNPRGAEESKPGHPGCCPWRGPRTGGFSTRRDFSPDGEKRHCPVVCPRISTPPTYLPVTRTVVRNILALKDGGIVYGGGQRRHGPHRCHGEGNLCEEPQPRPFHRQDLFHFTRRHDGEVRFPAGRGSPGAVFRRVKAARAQPDAQPEAGGPDPEGQRDRAHGLAAEDAIRN